MNSIHALLLLAPAAFCNLGSNALAQGVDDCATPQPILGAGPHAFDNTAATTGLYGQSEAVCNFFGTTGIMNDVWFTWTGTSDGIATLSLCGTATIDSKVSIFDGSTCPAAVALACNDDSCGLQSQVTFGCVSGQAYTIQLGNYPGAAVGTGTFTINVQPYTSFVQDTRTNPANGHTYHLLLPSSWTAAESVAVGLHGHLATVNDQAEQDWIVQQWHVFQAQNRSLWIGLNDAAVEGTFAWSSGETASYTNWDAGEPNAATALEDYTHMRFDSATGAWNDLPNAGTSFFAEVLGVVEIAPTSTLFCFGDGSGAACPCANNSAPGNDEGCLNSLTVGARLRASGNSSLASDTLVLQGSNMPNAAALYFQGTTQLSGGAGVTFGDGLRCAGGTIIRLATKTNASGTSQYPAAGDASVSVRGLVTSPGTRAYQVWYRNAAAFCTSATFNLSNGISISWT